MAECNDDKVPKIPSRTDKIYPDPDVKGDICESDVRCLYYKEGCQWIDQLDNLEGHLETCRYNNVLCPNDCSAQLSRMSLEDHLHYACPRRRVTCEFCSQEYSGEAMEMHEGNCLCENVWCENKCGARLKRRFLSNHMRNECHKRTLPCQYCRKEFVFETLQLQNMSSSDDSLNEEHYYRCPRFLVACPNRCDPTKIPREDLELHLQEQCPSASVCCLFKEAGCDVTYPRFQEDKHLAEAVKDHLSLMCNLVVQQKEQIEDLTSQIQHLNQVTDGTMIWKITNFKAKMHEARQNPDWELKSRPFYTSRYGYKLGASVFLNGNGSGEGKFMSVYIKVLPGHYDNILEWPFKLPISFTLQDQCFDPEKRLPIRESFVPNISWKHFQKPTKEEDSMGFGYPRFVSHDSLKNGTYVKEDSLFIRIKVDSPHIIVR